MNKYDNVGHLRYKSSKKELTFEYVVRSLIDWWIESNPNKSFEENDLGKLKIMKLLFFVVASSTNNETVGLLNIFNNWLARPYGHEEDDISQLIDFRKGEFKNFIITKEKIVLK